MVTMMVRRKGGGEEGGIDGRWGDEDGREHRSLVVGNDEQGGGEKKNPVTSVAPAAPYNHHGGR